MLSQSSYNGAFSVHSLHTATSATLYSHDPRESQGTAYPSAGSGGENSTPLEANGLEEHLARPSADVHKARHISEHQYKSLAKLRTHSRHSIVPPSVVRILFKALAGRLKRGRADWLVNILVTLPEESLNAVFASLPVLRWEENLWRWRENKNDLVLTDREKPRSLLYKLIDAVCHMRDNFDRYRVSCLFDPYPSLRPFAELFPIQRSSLGVQYPTTLSSTYQAIDRFMRRLEDVYEDLPLGMRRSEATPHFHWLLEASGIFLATSTAPTIQYAVDRILRRIRTRPAPILQYTQPEGHTISNSEFSSALKAGSSVSNEHLDATGDAHSRTNHSPRRISRHPASPFLLLSIYLAKHSKPASKAMVAKGLLATLQELFDEPSPSIAGQPPVVSTYSRQIMYELSHELLVRISRHVDLRNCTLKQELYDEIVAASRALSARYFDIQWWELINEDLHEAKVRKAMQNAD